MSTVISSCLEFVVPEALISVLQPPSHGLLSQFLPCQKVVVYMVFGFVLLAESLTYNPLRRVSDFLMTFGWQWKIESIKKITHLHNSQSIETLPCSR